MTHYRYVFHTFLAHGFLGSQGLKKAYALAFPSSHANQPASPCLAAFGDPTADSIRLCICSKCLIKGEFEWATSQVHMSARHNYV